MTKAKGNNNKLQEILMISLEFYKVNPLALLFGAGRGTTSGLSCSPMHIATAAFYFCTVSENGPDGMPLVTTSKVLSPNSVSAATVKLVDSAAAPL